MAVIGVGTFRTEGGDLHKAGFCDNGNGAVLFPRKDQTVIHEDAFHLLRGGIGAQVIIVRRQSQYRVPDTTAHTVGGMACAFQGIQTGIYIFRDPHSLFLVGLGLPFGKDLQTAAVGKHPDSHREIVQRILGSG